MIFLKTLVTSVINSFQVFRGKELIELLYLAYAGLWKVEKKFKVFLYLFSLILLILVKTDSIICFFVCWLLQFIALAILRPSVDLKNFKYIFSYVLVCFKLLALFSLLFYVPYTVLHPNMVPSDSLALVLFFSLITLMIPHNMNILKTMPIIVLSLFIVSLFLGFKSLIYHLLLIFYLHLQQILGWIFFFLLLDEKLFSVAGFLGFLTSPVIIFLTLSLLDSRKTLLYQMYGLARGLKLYVLNYPISLISFYLLKLLIIYGNKLFDIQSLIPQWLLVIFFVFIYYFYLSFLTNIYIKKIHEQF